MKQRGFFVAVGMLLTAFLLCVYVYADEPEWIQYTEPLAGANSPEYSDVLNRPALTIWNNFLVEHDSSGFHNYSALAANMDIDVSSKLDVSVFQVDHNADGSHMFTIPSTTDDLTEGANLFYTDTRVSTNSSVTANTTHRQTTGNPHSTTPADIGAIADSLFLVEHNADGTHVTGGGVQYYGLQSDAHTYTLASLTTLLSSEFLSDELQISVFAAVDDLAVAERFFRIEDVDYTCTVLEFGKNASNQLYLTHTTDAGSCLTTTYTSTFTLGAQQQGRMVEYAVKVDEGTGITFYMEGTPDTPHAMTTAHDDSYVYNNWTFTLFDGFKGVAGPVKVGNAAVWPDSFKGIDRSGESFPYAIAAWGLSDGADADVADSLGILTLTIPNLDAGVSWVEIPGPF